MFRSGSPDQLAEALLLSVSSYVPRGYLPLYETQMQAANPRKSPRDTSFAPQVLQQLKSFVLLHFLQVKHPVESVRGDPSSYQIIQAQRRVMKALTAIRQWETLTVWQRKSIA